ncbi:hypothetical protein HBI71_059950 [Parastagonospora nodorum]|nr:hypothetical protein HBI71_059950 [Parastagonospora nodorum]
MKEEAEAAVDAAKGVLQDLVVVVSLVRTLTESFGSARDLYRKLKPKSKSDSHSSDDEKEEREKWHHRPFRRRRDSSPDSDRDRGRRHVRWKLDARKEEYTDSDEELISTSSSQVLAEYDRGYRKLGEGFARGDLVTQTQLQAQIIQLQRTLLSIHQDYMLSSYLSPSSSHSHVLRLIQTTRSARMASIQALQLQCQRMSETGRLSVPDPYHSIPGAFPVPPEPKPRHDSVTERPDFPKRRGDRCDSPGRDPEEITIQPYPNPRPKPTPPQDSDPRRGDRRRSPVKDPEEITIQPYPTPRPKPIPPEDSKLRRDGRYNDPIRDPGGIRIQPYPNPRPKPSLPHQSYNNKVFCIYARDLQKHPRLNLTDSYKAGGNSMCPYCHAYNPVRPGKAWEIIADSRNRNVHERHRFLIKNRFVIKSHQEGAGFACIFCARFREADTVCRRVEGLMEHLWKDHTSEELERDEDVFEIDNGVFHAN